MIITGNYNKIIFENAFNIVIENDHSCYCLVAYFLENQRKYKRVIIGKYFEYNDANDRLKKIYKCKSQKKTECIL